MRSTLRLYRRLRLARYRRTSPRPRHRQVTVQACLADGNLAVSKHSEALVYHALFKGVETMTAFNVVRFKVKPGMEEAFLDAHRDIAGDWPGLRHANIIKSGEGRFCIIAEWESMEALAAGRPQMVATLDSFRQTLEDLGGGLGVTDPVSGAVVLSLK
jgi:quinol monooxygenase YgiN